MRVRVVGAAGISQGIFDHWENSGQVLSLTARVLPADAGAVLADDGRVIGIVRRHSPWEVPRNWRRRSGTSHA